MTATIETQTQENTNIDNIIDDVLAQEGIEGVEVEEIAQQVAEETGTTSPPKQRGKAPRTPAEEFVSYWNEAENPAQVAEHFDITKTSASAKATQLRKKGYELKTFPRGRKKGQKVVSSTPTKAMLRAQIEALVSALTEVGGNPEEVFASVSTED